jgi:hypothetical protein
MGTNNCSKRKYKLKFNKTIKRIRKTIGGNIDYTLEEIYHYCNEEYNKQFPNDTRDPVNGEFVVHKEFKIKSKINPRKRKIYGYVIQKVEKTTDAYIIKDNIQTKIANISEFTNNYVNYMNESYYELFFIIDGISTYGDNFQNGAILEYTYNNSNGSYGPDDRTDTKGIIRIKGTSWFISATENEVKINQNIVNSNSEMNINNVGKSINILGINWSLDKNSPANGLPFILIEEGKEIETLKRDSNILEHNVEVKWNTTKRINGISESFTKSTFKQIA